MTGNVSNILLQTTQFATDQKGSYGSNSKNIAAFILLRA